MWKRGAVAFVAVSLAGCGTAPADQKLEANETGESKTGVAVKASGKPANFALGSWRPSGGQCKELVDVEITHWEVKNYIAGREPQVTEVKFSDNDGVTQNIVVAGREVLHVRKIDENHIELAGDRAENCVLVRQ